MKKSGALTPRRVTADWAAALPGFDVWKPLHLLRRIGPVVQGVCLDRTTSGNEYMPTAHVHALARDFPVISLMLGQRLEGASGQPERVLFANHDGEYRAAVGALRVQSVLSLSEEPPSLEQVVRAYHSAASASYDKPPRFWPETDIRWVEANGRPAALVTSHGDAVALVTADVSERGIERIMWVVSPPKLAAYVASLDN